MATYDNQFGPDNSYGRALALLVAHRRHDIEPGALHIDLGAGWGHVGQPIQDALELHYVAVDGDAESVDAVRARGLEGHTGTLSGMASTLEMLERVSAGRPVASLSMLDVIEHLPDPGPMLAAVAEFATRHGALVVVSVPNVTHTDVGFKLAFGRWDVTESGLLDRTHLRYYSRLTLDAELRAAGLYRFDEADVVLAQSDQHFPSTHPALGDRTSLNGYLRSLRRTATGDQLVNQFVWVCSPGPLSGPGAVTLTREEPRPFLSVVVRTQGSRSDCLSEALTCLEAQTSQDFEVVIVAHKVKVEQQIGVERLIEECSPELRSRIRLIVLDRGSRSAPLNVGFEAARGRYIAIYDDDDILFGHWVETFAAAERAAGGRMIRTVSAPQDFDHVEVLGESAPRATSRLHPRYPLEFDFLQHLRDNYTPNTGVAFPRGVFHDLGQRFDEELSTTEDWDFMMRVASIVGVVSVPAITCIYRWWSTQESSRTVHDNHEWLRNSGAVLKKFDESEILFPAGSARRVREILRELDELRDAVRRHEIALGHAVPPEPDGRVPLLGEIQSILDSRSWRVSAPLRGVSRIFGRGRRVVLSDYVGRSTPELQQAINELRSSRSWRVTYPLRRSSR